MEPVLLHIVRICPVQNLPLIDDMIQVTSIVNENGSIRLAVCLAVCLAVRHAVCPVVRHSGRSTSKKSIP